jgi:amino acid transporter
MMRVAYSPGWGATTGMWLGRLAAVLVMATAFASVFSLLLGYSRIPYAAARDDNFPRIFARLHPQGRFPYVSLLVLSAAACVFCFFSLADVIAALVVLRIVLQFGLQQVGVVLLRLRRPEMHRPFRVWLYPLPPLLALAGFAYIVISRPGFHRELILAGAVAIIGTIVFGSRSIFASAALTSSPGTKKGCNR